MVKLVRKDYDKAKRKVKLLRGTFVGQSIHRAVDDEDDTEDEDEDNDVIGTTYT